MLQSSTLSERCGEAIADMYELQSLAENFDPLRDKFVPLRFAQ